MSASIKAGLVSVIIPVYNRSTLIGPSVQSVLDQGYRPIELIIVDDGSTDNTPEILQELAEQYSEVRVITQDNAGPGSAREIGRRIATGEFIQYHDSDDLLLPNKFSLQVSALQTDLQADVAYGKTKQRFLNDDSTNKTEQNVALKGTGKKHLAMFPFFLRRRWWSTSTPLYRRSVTNEAGAWMATSCEEDWEYDCRIASLGGRLAFVDEFVSITQVHDTRLSSGGTVDAIKLRHRCLAQHEIFKHAHTYMQLDSRATDIAVEDWSFYSKSLFLLGRQCALAGLEEEAKSMFKLSIDVLGYKTTQHRLFLFLVALFGWRGAAKIIVRLGR